MCSDQHCFATMICCATLLRCCHVEIICRSYYFVSFFFFFLQFTLFQIHNWFFFLLLSSSFYLFCYLNCHFFGCLFLNKCLVLFGIKIKWREKFMLVMIRWLHHFTTTKFAFEIILPQNSPPSECQVNQSLKTYFIFLTKTMTVQFWLFFNFGPCWVFAFSLHFLLIYYETRYTTSEQSSHRASGKLESNFWFLTKFILSLYCFVNLLLNIVHYLRKVLPESFR